MIMGLKVFQMIIKDENTRGLSTKNKKFETMFLIFIALFYKAKNTCI